MALAPLLLHFQTEKATSMVHLVAQRAADIGGILALFWFLLNLVQLLDERLRHWAEASQSTIDDMLAPLVGKTLRIFCVCTCWPEKTPTDEDGVVFRAWR